GQSARGEDSVDRLPALCAAGGCADRCCVDNLRTRCSKGDRANHCATTHAPAQTPTAQGSETRAASDRFWRRRAKLRAVAYPQPDRRSPFALRRRRVVAAARVATAPRYAFPVQADLTAWQA